MSVAVHAAAGSHIPYSSVTAEAVTARQASQANGVGTSQPPPPRTSSPASASPRSPAAGAAPAVGGGADDVLARPGGPAAALTASNWVRMHERLEALAEQTDRIGGMQLQLDALLHHSKLVHERLVLLDSGAEPQLPEQGVPTRPDGADGRAATLCAAAAASVVVGVLLGHWLGSRRS